jgi:uncharacterized protein YecT (DUF1311 family)
MTAIRTSIFTLALIIFLTGCALPLPNRDDRANDSSSNDQSADIEREKQQLEQERAELEAQRQELEREKIRNDKEARQKAVTKQRYLDKLAAVEASFSDLQPYYDNGSTYDLNIASGEEYTRWDRALNEIWAQLKLDMPANEFEVLKQAQRNWITDRDRKAELDAADWEGGTGYTMIYNGSLAETTKRRCYELVNQYM